MKRSEGVAENSGLRVGFVAALRQLPHRSHTTSVAELLKNKVILACFLHAIFSSHTFATTCNARGRDEDRWAGVEILYLFLFLKKRLVC